MEKRRKEISDLPLFIENVEKELTMILQTLQWDQKKILEGPCMVTCKYNNNHKLPIDEREAHEKECLIKSQGYAPETIQLPDPLHNNMETLVRLDKNQIANIINVASCNNQTFQKGSGNQDVQEPLSLERLQSTYTADERRAIHDAVVSAVPSCHDLTDLALISTSEDQQASKSKSRLEILAELRDMKRRRTKYRVAAKTRNYSDVLRDVIKTQMELYIPKAEVKNEVKVGRSYKDNSYQKDSDIRYERNKRIEDSRHRGDDISRNKKRLVENDERDQERHKRHKRDLSERKTRDDYDRYKHRDMNSKDGYNEDHKARKYSQKDSKYYEECRQKYDKYSALRFNIKKEQSDEKDYDSHKRGSKETYSNYKDRNKYHSKEQRVDKYRRHACTSKDSERYKHKDKERYSDTNHHENVKYHVKKRDFNDDNSEYY